MKNTHIISLFLLCSVALNGNHAIAQDVNDLVFIHHSVGQNWLNNSLHSALLAKDYIDERNDIYYGTDLPPDSGRPDSLAPFPEQMPGDYTDMNHWLLWFNDYLDGVKSHGCSDGINRIIMFKSCFPNSNITSDGGTGNPFSDTKTIANYKAVYWNPGSSEYWYEDYWYKPLEDIFAENPNTLFIPITAPPRNYAPWDETNNAEAHRARVFNNWLKSEWLASYNATHPGLNNVTVFDFFDVLAYSDNDSNHPNRLRAEYGGESGDSHPNAVANSYSTQVFATGLINFIDNAWLIFTQGLGTLKLLTPNGSEQLFTGNHYEIIWQTIGGGVTNIRIEYSTNNGGDWNDVDITANTGSYMWQVPKEYSQQCLIRINDASNPTINDVSNAIFTIYSTMLLGLNGGEELFAGTDHEITWQTEGVAGNVRIEYSINNGSDWGDVDTVPNTGSYMWRVPQENSHQCLIRISDTNIPTNYDVSDGVFRIYTGTLRLFDPNGGEELVAGTRHEISWETEEGSVAEVLIEYSTSGGVYWRTISTVENTGSYQWHIPQRDSRQCLVRINDANRPDVNDISNGLFTIYRLIGELTGDCCVNLIDFSMLTDMWLTSNEMKQDKLVAPNTIGSYQFGVSVSISGNYAIIGDNFGDVEGNSSGSAYIFKHNGTTWDEQSTLFDAEGEVFDYFGRSVSIGSNYAIVGAPGDDVSGAAYIFKCSDDNNDPNWYQQAKLIASGGETGDSFGCSVSIDSNYAIVGAEGDDDNGNNSGSAYIFKSSDDNNDPNWYQQLKLKASDGETDDRFGSSVSISGNYAIIGNPGDDSAYMFKCSGDNNDPNWYQQTKLTAPNNETSFGNSVSIDGDRVIVGAPSDSAYIFKYDSGTESWIQEAKLFALDDEDGFGYPVSISGDCAIVGATHDDENGYDFGSAYVFKYDGKNWRQQEAKLIASDGGTDDYFGLSVCISGEHAIIGAFRDDNSGSAYIFKDFICPLADLSGDCSIGWEDLEIFAYQWLQCGNYSNSDMSQDCCTNFTDFGILASQWFQVSGRPSADIAPNGGDGIVDWLDLEALIDNWLK